MYNIYILTPKNQEMWPQKKYRARFKLFLFATRHNDTEMPFQQCPPLIITGLDHFSREPTAPDVSTRKCQLTYAALLRSGQAVATKILKQKIQASVSFKKQTNTGTALVLDCTSACARCMTCIYHMSAAGRVAYGIRAGRAA